MNISEQEYNKLPIDLQQLFVRTETKVRSRTNHCTVKPIKLMEHLVNLVTPPNGIVLDPFAGSGTTGEAAVKNGFFPIMIEKEKEHFDDIYKRMNRFFSDMSDMSEPNGKNKKIKINEQQKNTVLDDIFEYI